MRRHKKDNVATETSGSDPVDTFLAQSPSVEEEGLDEAAIEREKLLHGGPDADAISEAIQLMNEHHELR